MKRIMIFGITLDIIITGCIVILALIVGWAPCAKDVKPIIIEDSRYDTYTYNQLVIELQRIEDKIIQTSAHQNIKRRNDIIATSLGVIVHVTAFLYLLTEDRQEELAELKGERELLIKLIERGKDAGNYDSGIPYTRNSS